MARELSAMGPEPEEEKEADEQQSEKSPQSLASLRLQDEEDCPAFARSFGEDILSLPSAEALVVAAAASGCCQQAAAESHYFRPLELPMMKQDGSFFEFSDFEH
ncbi:uncharacterized protein EMH_0064620 [Eimeria mitis]|uniref:Uncharacterized protein n=1 Tax=Eimeria mitis TaxID=44415 RepID=U6K0A6_9EIME|nr:uncharacterized protein EMH_0064620 [Eimeria mitis]CDJ31175.1 hypothetical protein EMH_0064620 [Eimeria mitis]